MTLKGKVPSPRMRSKFDPFFQSSGCVQSTITLSFTFVITCFPSTLMYKSNHSSSLAGASRQSTTHRYWQSFGVVICIIYLALKSPFGPTFFLKAGVKINTGIRMGQSHHLCFEFEILERFICLIK